MLNASLRRTLGFVAVALFALAGCGTTSDATPDLGLVNNGCRLPSACFFKNCPCNRLSLDECKACDPATATGGTCDCTSLTDDIECLQPVEACIGRGPVCTGRCVIVGQTCDSMSGEPPQKVAISTDGGSATFESRCAYADDICCEGTAQPDLAVPDLASVD